MLFIEINISHTDRIAEIWLTKKEKQNKSFQKTLKPLYAKYKEQKYTVAVYFSGDNDLTDKTTGLILHNR